MARPGLPATTGTPPDGFKSGFVALVGRPNGGKSTLLNAAAGKKLAITSPVVQTTRQRIRAVINRPDGQLVLVDTPGLHKPKDALGRCLNQTTLLELADADAIAFVLDATRPLGVGDEWILTQLKRLSAPCILVCSKAKLAQESQIKAQLQAAEQRLDFSEKIVLSVLEESDAEVFVQACFRLLGPGPLWFGPDQRTDQSLEVWVVELIREQVLHTCFAELPHAVAVQLEQLDYDAGANRYHISALIYVDRMSQKGIVVGKDGAMIKAIGSQARQEMERLLDARIFLDLRVKLRKNWRRDENQLRRLGYGG